jgi:hypothetical protein
LRTPIGGRKRLVRGQDRPQIAIETDSGRTTPCRALARRGATSAEEFKPRYSPDGKRLNASHTGARFRPTIAGRT